MTIHQIYLASLALMGEREADCPSLEPFIIPYINRLLIDSFQHNNSILISNKLPVLSSPQQVVQMEDELIYDELLINDCFPYGLATYFCTDDDRDKYNLLNFEYSTRLTKYLKAEFTNMEGYN